MATYPRTIYFPESNNRVVLNVMPGGKFSAVDPDQPQDGQPLIWGYGRSESEAIFDLEQSIREQE